MSEQIRHQGNGGVHSNDPAEIERELAGTRRHLARTMDELSGRASTAYVSDRAMDYLRDASGVPRDYFRNLGDTIRYHPMPVTLLGISLAWLMASGSSRPEREPWRPATSTGGESTTGRLKQGYQQMRESARQQSHGLKERVKGMTERVRSSREEMGDRAELARIQAQRRREEIGSRAGRMSDSLTRTYHEQPVFVGLLGLAIGSVIGGMIPQRATMSEEMRERALSAARDPFAKMAEKGREAVAAAGEKAREGVAEAAEESREKMEQKQPHPPSPDIH